MSEQNSYPVHDEIDVLDGETIYKNDNWWKAVVTCDSWNEIEINVYLWQKQDGEWKRKQKYKVNDKQEWLATKSIVDDMISEYIGKDS